jgi:sugar O-acyltransferase (sialic acid O-acetyltransferase NeuD family)
MNTNEKLVIVGAGGFGREILGWFGSEILGPEVKGFLSDDEHILDNYNLGYHIIGNTFDYKIQPEDRFIMAIGSIQDKKNVSKRLLDRGGEFKTIVHETALLSKTASLGIGCVVGPFALVSDHVKLEDFTMMGFYSSCGHDAQVGKYCILSPYATVNGFTILEDEVFMGTHSSVAARKRIGCNSMISSGSAAMYDVPGRCLVFGVPGKNQVIF